MKIEVQEHAPETALVSGRREVWLRVMSNEVVDLPRIRKALSPEQASLLASCTNLPVSFHPDEDPEGVYPFCEWWIFEVID